MTKVVYIIPGYGGTAKDPEAKKLVKLFQAHGIKPVIVKINWKMKAKKLIRFYDFVDQFLKQYKKQIRCMSWDFPWEQRLRF